MSEQVAGTALTNPPILPGGRYDITAKLGEGGMAVVYRAFDKENSAWCAVKVLHSKYLRRPKIRQRFTAEAEAMKRLRHRNVVQVFEVDTMGTKPFFAMELAEGGCVVDWLERYGPMPPRMACDVAIQICKGLGAAHRHGVIHRDVKPHNILVNRRGVCKITDFGIAHLDDSDQASMTRTGSVMGTLGYIAPEQRSNSKDVDERTDLYSIGATLFTMLTARTTMDLFFADQEPELIAGIPDALKPIVLKSTRYRREDRYDSVRQMAKALYHAKADLPEDAEDTPSLVMNEALGADDYHSHAGPEFESLGASLTDDSGFTPTDPGGRLMSTMDPRSDEKPTSTPGIPRQRLLRSDSMEKSGFEFDLSGKTAFRVLLALAPLVVVVVIAMLLVAMGSSAIGQVEERALAERQAYFEVLEVQQPDILADLTAIGANRASLDAAYERQRTATDPVQRLDAAAEYTHQLREALSEHHPRSAASDRLAHANRVKINIGKLDEARDTYRARVADWQAMTQTLHGRAALVAGVAEGPPGP
jgi:serine/threonine protein kinase